MKKMETRINIGKMIKLPFLIIFLLILSTCLFSLIGNLIRMEREGEMTYFKCYPTSYNINNGETCGLLFSPTAAIFFAIGSVLILLITITCLSLGSECMKIYKLVKQSPRSMFIQRTVAENYTIGTAMEVTSISSEQDLNQNNAEDYYKDEPPNYNETPPPIYEDAIRMSSLNNRY